MTMQIAPPFKMGSYEPYALLPTSFNSEKQRGNELSGDMIFLQLSDVFKAHFNLIKQFSDALNTLINVKYEFV
ncbi:MAG: hypothetical protein IJG51_05605 [Synergistaceae bacterium]|nr:hypothetical protein [Synergistaceae bacterium]